MWRKIELGKVKKKVKKLPLKPRLNDTVHSGLRRYFLFAKREKKIRFKYFADLFWLFKYHPSTLFVISLFCVIFYVFF